MTTPFGRCADSGIDQAITARITKASVIRIVLLSHRQYRERARHEPPARPWILRGGGRRRPQLRDRQIDDAGLVIERHRSCAWARLDVLDEGVLVRGVLMEDR